MSKLTAAQRHALPASTFALPGGRFPIPDRSHAIDAKARASEGYNKGTLSAAQKATVDRKADAKLGGAPHPREHALAMASADHLHRGGYISGGQRDQIRAKAAAKMDDHMAAKPKAFGALG